MYNEIPWRSYSGSAGAGALSLAIAALGPFTTRSRGGQALAREGRRGARRQTAASETEPLGGMGRRLRRCYSSGVCRGCRRGHGARRSRPQPRVGELHVDIGAALQSEQPINQPINQV